MQRAKRERAKRERAKRRGWVKYMSVWRNGYRVRLLIGRLRVRAPPWTQGTYGSSAFCATVRRSLSQTPSLIAIEKSVKTKQEPKVVGVWFNLFHSEAYERLIRSYSENGITSDGFKVPNRNNWIVTSCDHPTTFEKLEELQTRDSN